MASRIKLVINPFNCMELPRGNLPPPRCEQPSPQAIYSSWSLLVPAPQLFPPRPGHRERWQTSNSRRPHPGPPCALQPGDGASARPAWEWEWEGPDARSGAGLGAGEHAPRGREARRLPPRAGRAADPAPLHTWPGIAELSSGIAPGQRRPPPDPVRLPSPSILAARRGSHVNPLGPGPARRRCHPLRAPPRRAVRAPQAPADGRGRPQRAEPPKPLPPRLLAARPPSLGARRDPPLPRTARACLPGRPQPRVASEAWAR